MTSDKEKVMKEAEDERLNKVLFCKTDWELIRETRWRRREELGAKKIRVRAEGEGGISQIST